MGSGLFLCLQSFTIATQHSLQKKKPAAYSKFSKDRKQKEEKEESSWKVSPQMGACLAYSLPFIAGGTFLAYQFYTRCFDKSKSLTMKNIIETVRNLDVQQKCILLPAFMVFTHFSKRIFECFFVHKYSAKSHKLNLKGLRLVLGISAGYATLSFGCMFYQNKAPREYNETRVKIGTAVWALGLLGNGYHHWILSTLRKDAKSVKNVTDKKKKYSIPNGGLFGLVWTPHYFFELMGWYGIAITANTLNYWMAALGYTSYLSGRAKSTQEWYLNVFKDDTRLDGNNRKALVPFL